MKQQTWRPFLSTMNFNSGLKYFNMPAYISAVYYAIVWKVPLHST